MAVAFVYFQCPEVLMIVFCDLLLASVSLSMILTRHSVLRFVDLVLWILVCVFLHIIKCTLERFPDIQVTTFVFPSPPVSTQISGN